MKQFLTKDKVLKSFAKDFSLVFLVNIAGRIISFFTHIILARIAGSFEYGVYVYVLSWVLILGILVKGGVDTSFLRLIPEYRSQKLWSSLKGVLWRGYHYVLIIATGLIGFYYILVWWFKSDLSDKGYYETFLLGGILLILIPFFQTRLALLRALKKVVLSKILGRIAYPLIFLSIVGLGALIMGQYTGRDIMGLSILAYACAVGGILMLISKFIPNEVKDVQPEYHDSKWINLSITLLFVSSLHLLFRRVDILMIGSMLDAQQAGIYTASVRITDFALFGLTTVNAVFIPMISELYHSQKIRELQKMATFAARIVFIITVAIVGILALAGNQLLYFFGGDFTTGYYALLILLVGKLFSALCGTVGYFMYMTGHHKEASVILTLTLVVNVAANYAFIPMWGIEGAALATTITFIIWNVVMLYFVRTRLQINTTIFNLK